MLIVIMKTIVAKGDMFSQSNKLLMIRAIEHADIDVKVVFVYPTGITETIMTTMTSFEFCNLDNGDSSIIYS